MYYTYFMFRRKYSAPEIGTYYSCDIVVYGPLYRGPVRIVRDVSTNSELVRRMVTAFNEKHLPPDQLTDAIIDFFDMN